MDLLEFVCAIAIIPILVIGYVAGTKARAITHSCKPFKEPLSLIGVTITAIIITVILLAFRNLVDTLGVWLGIFVAAAWAGYLLAYKRNNHDDIIWVALHQMVERTQEIEPLVIYHNREGQKCWQPQSFKEICKTTLFGIDNPIQIMGNVNRTRYVSFTDQNGVKKECDAVDMADLEVDVYEVEKFGRTFVVESRKYIPAPTCTDAPYDFILRTLEYDDVFTEYTKLQVEASEHQAAIQMAQVKGAAMILNALSASDPSQYYTEILGNRMEEQLNKRNAHKVVRDAAAESAVLEEAAV